MKYKVLIIGILIFSVGLIVSIALINTIDSNESHDNTTENGDDSGEESTTEIKYVSWEYVSGDIELGTFKGRELVLQLYSSTSQSSAKTKASFQGFISGIIEIDLYFILRSHVEDYTEVKIYLLDDTVKVITYKQSWEDPLEEWLRLRITFDCETGEYTLSMGGIIREIEQSFSATEINGILIEVPYHGYIEWEISNWFPQLKYIADNYLYADFKSITGIRNSN
ncbi:MAG: hypothetical protein ACFFDF_24225 [Candidatus Odinarchaeota archaeon]